MGVVIVFASTMPGGGRGGVGGRAAEEDVRGHTAARSVRRSATLPSAWRADCRSLRSHALSPAIYVGRHSGSNYYLCAWGGTRYKTV